MTAEVQTTLHCNRDTRPALDGTRTVCGERFGPTTFSVERTRYLAREFGWVHTGISDYCPRHTSPRRGT